MAHADCLQRTIYKQHKEIVSVKEDLYLSEAIVTLEQEYQELKQKYNEEQRTWKIKSLLSRMSRKITKEVKIIGNRYTII